jgi:ADP-ribosylglycohydrolase
MDLREIQRHSERAHLSLEGLSIGDAFGEQFFGDHATVVPSIVDRIVPPAPWRYTDDTEMAMSIVEILDDHGVIDQGRLATRFAERMDPHRGYGKGAYEILSGVLAGGDWRALSRSGFRGMGSFGNGAAMRVAPLGAYFAEAPRAALIEQARRSAEVTHAHPEGIAGAIAVAAAPPGSRSRGETRASAATAACETVMHAAVWRADTTQSCSFA